MIGIYGVVNYAVSQRAQEIGIRVALRASRRDIVGLIVRQGFGPSIAGLLIGVLMSLATTRFVARVLYEVTPTDPATILVVSLVLLGIALVASIIPALQASRLDPLKVLRRE